MEFTIASGALASQKADCLVLPIFEGKEQHEMVTSFDKKLNGMISNLIKSKDISGEFGNTFLYITELTNIKRVLFIGLGKQKDLSAKKLNKAMSKIMPNMKSPMISSVLVSLSKLEIEEYPVQQLTQNASVAMADSIYEYNDYKSVPKPKAKEVKKKINVTFAVNGKREVQKAEEGCRLGSAIVSGMKVTKDLGNMPPNVCDPTYLAKTAKGLSKTYKKLSYAVLEEKDMRSLKMGCFLSVTKGATTPAKLITMQYKGGAKNQAPTVFVGKGITFDTGGNSLKPPGSMVGMKYDMCGAATVMGLMEFVAKADLAVNVIGVIAAAENMPGADASRPDDIVTSMAGHTVEILNTDAEGRLVLCDTLTYCERYKPKAVIDMATLTGACVVALGRHNTAVYSNKDELAAKIIDSGNTCFDTGWHMPMSQEYDDQLKSKHADFANIGGSEAGSVTAACFLGRFTKAYSWAHLDIAGTACGFNGPSRGATGRPVPMLANYLLNNA